MNREIKFRIFSKDKKSMYYPSWSFLAIFFEKEDKEDLVCMQYTGLKDKNGVEVYEGDILKIPENNIIAVVAYEEQKAGFFAQIKSFDEILSARIDNLKERNIEIIGNIYENPKLLK